MKGGRQETLVRHKTLTEGVRQKEQQQKEKTSDSIFARILILLREKSFLASLAPLGRREIITSLLSVLCRFRLAGHICTSPLIWPQMFGGSLVRLTHHLHMSRKQCGLILFQGFVHGVYLRYKAE